MSEAVPEYYGDIYFLRSTPWGVAITFTASSPKEGVYEHDVCVVRLSHTTAKDISQVSSGITRHRHSAFDINRESPPRYHTHATPSHSP